MNFDKRMIFKYHNGTTEVQADPLVIERKLRAKLPKLDEVMRDIYGYFEMANMKGATPEVLANMTEKTEANIVLATEAARDVFGIQAFHVNHAGDQVGLTEQEVLDILAQWMKFGVEVKNEVAPLSSSPEHTASELSNSTTDSSSGLSGAPSGSDGKTPAKSEPPSASPASERSSP